MKFGYIRQDESSHYYVIPEDEIKEFDLLLEIVNNYSDTDFWFDKVDEFNERYSGYRIQGGTHSLKVLME